MRWFCLLMPIVLLSAIAGCHRDLENRHDKLQQKTDHAIGNVPNVENSSTAEISLPDDVSQDWWSSVQRGLAEAEYRVSENGQGLQAPNRAHNLRTYFDSTGIRVYDRTAAAGSPELFGLSLVGIGRGDALVPVSAGKVNHAGTRVEMRHDRIVEWYENSAKGLEHGFSLGTRPEGEGPLALELAVEGARATVDGEAVVFATGAGRRLRYSGLIVEDAAGRIVASRLEVPGPERVRLVVDDAGAKYPLLIDPLITGLPDATLESNDVWDQSFDSAMFGASVASAGDVNGDGLDDVVIGAHGWDNGLFDEGAAFVFLGSANGMVGTDPTTANAFLLSDEAAVEFGWSVSGRAMSTATATTISSSAPTFTAASSPVPPSMSMALPSSSSAARLGSLASARPPPTPASSAQ